MADLRYAGVGWPVGAVDRETILALPSDLLLLCATEGRYQLDAALRAGKRPIWRAIPRHGHRPAELGYDVRRFADEAMNLTDEPEQPPGEMILWNELDLNSERGDGEDDWSDLDARYQRLGRFQLGVISEVRERQPGVTLHYGAWTPDHDALTYAPRWFAAAMAADVVDVHAYDTLEKIRAQYEAYRAAFPFKHLFLAEWHGKGDLDEETRILAWLAETRRVDPLFWGAAFFIWEWPGAPGWWSTNYDIAHNPDRLALFMNPPIASGIDVGGDPGGPQPLPPPEIPMPTTINDMPLGIDVASYQGDPDWAAVAAAGISFAVEKASQGVSYVNPRFARNWAAIPAAGLHRLTYHFAEPDRHAPEAEATHFVATVLAEGLLAGDILALDLEDYEGSLTRTEDVAGWALRFLQETERRCGFAPLLYVSPSVIAEYGLSDPAFARYLLWLAAWGSAFPVCPQPWSEQPIGILLWQYTNALSVPGIAGLVDGDRFVFPIERLASFGKPADGAVPAGPDIGHPPPTAETMTVDAQAWERLVSFAGYTGDLADRVSALATKNKAATKERDAIVAELRRARLEALR